MKITAKPPTADAAQGVRHGDGGVREALHLLRGARARAAASAATRRSRSWPRSRGLVADGCREVTLLGQTVNAYGRDLTPPTDLAELFAARERRGRARAHPLHDLEPVQPHAAADPRPCATCPKVCEWFHLPLQSGSDRVLERMNRGYTRAQYLDADRRAAGRPCRTWRSPPTSSSGFPGETEADFAATLDDGRAGAATTTSSSSATRAGRARRPPTMPDQVADDGEGRAQRAAARGDHAGGAPSAAGACRARPSRCWSTARRSKNAGELSGRTRCNRVVNFDGQGRVAVGDIVHVRVTDVLPHSLRGTLAAPPEEAVCLSR